MRQFFNAPSGAFDDLEARASRACIVFADQEMPPGARPPRARVGIEGVGHGSLRLLVDRGVRFDGPEEEVRRWLSDGERVFSTYTQFQRWLTEVLAPCYAVPTTPECLSPAPCASAPQPLAPPATDLAEVTRQIEEQRRRTQINVPEEELFARLAATVLGQEAALRTLVRRVHVHLAQTEPRRPATLFSVGPTGVGKTSAAEALPEALRAVCPEASAYRFLRLDMSEYQERHRVSQLIGAPQGYIGYGEGAQLADTLAANPRTVVLFDEIEKAHPDVLRVLMNAMDAGRLSRAAGRGNGHEIDCRHAVFIFTSNLDADGILSDLEDHDGFDDSAFVNRVCRTRLRAAGIPPEIIGRIGAFMVFRPLEDAVRAEIITLTVQRVAQRYGVQVVSIAPSAVVALFEQCDGDFGARPAEYLVEDVLGPEFASSREKLAGCHVSIKGPPYSIQAAAEAERSTED